MADLESEAADLFAREEALRAEADVMLVAAGIGRLLAEAGYVAVGSYAMRTMTWRDLDFECHADADREAHWEIGARLMRTGWCWRFSYINAYREGQKGLYWGCRVADPALPGPFSKDDPRGWKLDVWRAPWEDFVASGVGRRERWAELMTEPKRATILAIKAAICHRPEYRDTMLSVHVYEAVLEQGVEDLDGFLSWWKARSED
jgi:hypothetical protein